MLCKCSHCNFPRRAEGKDLSQYPARKTSIICKTTNTNFWKMDNFQIYLCTRCTYGVMVAFIL